MTRPRRGIGRLLEAEARQSENHESNLSYRQNIVATENNVNFYTEAGNTEGMKHRYKNDVCMKVINYNYDIVT